MNLRQQYIFAAASFIVFVLGLSFNYLDLKSWSMIGLAASGLAAFFFTAQSRNICCISLYRI